jgi:DnaJ domain
VLQVAEMLDFYSVLGLSRHANHEEIKAAYWNLAKQSHPDVNAGDEQAEHRTKAINRAYETLGDPDARAAYDLELQNQRARARRSFWTSAVTGVATCILTVGSFTVMVMWKQHGRIHPSPSSEVALASGSAKNEHLVARPPTDQGASVPTNALAHAGGRDPLSEDVVDAPSEPVNMARNEELVTEPPAKERTNVPTAALASAEGSHASTEHVVGPPSERVDMARNEDLLAKPPADERASVPPAELANAEASHAPSQPEITAPSGPNGEPPRSAHAEVASAALRGSRAVPPSAVVDGSSDDELPNELWGTVQVPDGLRVLPAPAGEASRITEHGNGIAPEVGAKLPTSAAAVDQTSSATLALREEAKAPALPRANERTKRYFYKTAIAKPTTAGKPQGSEQASRLVAKSAMALRFPSADEPYINLGVRDR